MPMTGVALRAARADVDDAYDVPNALLQKKWDAAEQHFTSSSCLFENTKITQEK